jgi:inhibitor of KinA
LSIRVFPSGDTAIVIEFGNQIDRALSDRVLKATAAVRAADLKGVIETVSTFRSLMVHYDPLTVSASELEARIRPLIESGDDYAVHGRKWFLPVCYEAEKSPDLDNVAQRAGITTEEVVRMHSNHTYHVYMIGFLPGYPYMGDVPDALCFPRRETPRVRVPKGAVAIATTMTAVYTIESPGGWHLIGSTPVQLFDCTAPQPAILAAGDQVVFTPISLSEFDAIEANVASGAYTLEHKAIES